MKQCGDLFFSANQRQETGIAESRRALRRLYASAAPSGRLESAEMFGCQRHASKYHEVGTYTP